MSQATPGLRNDNLHDNNTLRWFFSETLRTLSKAARVLFFCTQFRARHIVKKETIVYGLLTMFQAQNRCFDPCFCFNPPNIFVKFVLLSFLLQMLRGWMLHWASGKVWICRNYFKVSFYRKPAAVSSNPNLVNLPSSLQNSLPAPSQRQLPLCL